MYEIFRAPEFDEWIEGRPLKIKLRVLARLDLMALGHFGDHKIFEGLVELRWRNGTRVYSFLYERRVAVLLFGGNKNGQDKDIKTAKKLQAHYVAQAPGLFEP